MLVSNGDASLAELWKVFLDRRWEEVYRHACDIYNEPEFTGHAIAGIPDEFGSPKDLLEEVFIKSLRAFKHTLCAPDGTTMLLPTGFAGGSSDIIQRLSVQESTAACEEFPGLVPRDDLLNQIGSSRFSAWPHKLCADREWTNVYPASVQMDETTSAGSGLNAGFNVCQGGSNDIGSLCLPLLYFGRPTR